MTEAICWAWLDGRLEVGKSGGCPEGALQCMVGDKAMIKNVLDTHAVVLYPAADNQADKYIIPDWPENADSMSKYIHVQEWLIGCRAGGYSKVSFIVNPASSREIKREAARALSSKLH